MNLSKIAVKSSSKVVAVPALSVFVHFAELAGEISESVGNAIELYIDYVGSDKLKYYLNKSGFWKDLTKRQYNRDMKLLKDYPDDLLSVVLEYNSENGVPGAYGLYTFLRDKPLETAPLGTNFLRFDFDHSWIEEGDAADQFVEFYQELLNVLPFQSSYVSYSFKRITNTEVNASRGVNKKISRYYGVDPGYEPMRRKMLNHVVGGNWLNAIDRKLVERLGGIKKIRADLPNSEIARLSNKGIFIRGAHLPPIGDINKGAEDIGSIPEIALLFKEIRMEIRAFGEPEFDASEWLSRYDELENVSWSVS